MAEDSKPARRRGEAKQQPKSLDALDIALDAAASGRQPAAPALRVLAKHEELLDQQIGLARNERFRNRIRAVRDMALAAVALAFALGVAAILWDARNAGGLVVEPLRTPPDLAATGVDGTVIASRLLDRLADMQSNTDSARAADTYSNNWGDDLEVEIADTGVSLGQITRFLRRTLGHETRITGEVVRTAKGVAITTRVGAGQPVTVEGPLESLASLIDQSAEGVYRQSQPYRYAMWLGGQNRRPERFELLRRQLASDDKEERLWALNGMQVDAQIDDRWPESISFSLQALELDPTFDKARWNLTFAYEILGYESLALASNRRTLEATSRRDRRVTEASRLQMHYVAKGRVATLLGDFNTALDAATDQLAAPEYSGARAQAPYGMAFALVGLHQVSDARRHRARGDLSTQPDTKSSAWLAILELTDLDAPVPAALITAMLAPHPDYSTFQDLMFGAPVVAPAMARNGDIAGAQALIRRTPLDCAPCIRARGEIAALAGQPRTADHWFGEAVRMTPDLPASYQAWGRVRLQRGDLAGALRLFRQAAQRGPRWADPLKYAGDVLRLQGKTGEARKLYAQAAEGAPKWGALHLAWGDALALAGKRDEARAKWRAAARLDLSAADRSGIRARLAAR